jgi:hypothetical protein
MALECFIDCPHSSQPTLTSGWKKLGPKLVALLEANARERPAKERAERLEARRTRLESLWKNIKEELSRSAHQATTLKTLVSSALAVSRLIPLPEHSDALQSPTMKQLLETELSIPELEVRFAQQRAEICEEAREWGVHSKTIMIDVVRTGFAKSRHAVGEPIVGTIALGSAQNPFKVLPPEMQMLLRADSVFSNSQSRFGPYSYERYPKSLRHILGDYSEKKLRTALDTNRFKFHTLASRIKRVLLKSLGRFTRKHIYSGAATS